MSAAVREAIAAAVNTVPGMHCTGWYRQTTKPGDAMVRLDRMERDASGFGFMEVWQVVVMLPQDTANAEKYLDDNLSNLIDAIGTELVVTTVTPQQLALDTTTVPVVFIEGNRAQ